LEVPIKETTERFLGRDGGRPAVLLGHGRVASGQKMGTRQAIFNDFCRVRYAKIIRYKAVNTPTKTCKSQVRAARLCGRNLAAVVAE
jgi:hypothetical protein